MKQDVVDKMIQYLNTATPEQLAEDYQELINNHEGPTVREYFQMLADHYNINVDELDDTDSSVQNTET